MKIRDRIVELRRVRAAELIPNPDNWRTHPKKQKKALEGLLEEVGYADALLARELEDGQLMLIDGHLRRETTPNEIVPVLVLDVDADEAKKMLATLDPLAGLAGHDKEILKDLMDEVHTDSEGIADLLEGLAKDCGILEQEEAEEGPDPCLEYVHQLMEQWGTHVGQVWAAISEDGSRTHRIKCGDSTDLNDVQQVMDGTKPTLSSDALTSE